MKESGEPNPKPKLPLAERLEEVIVGTGLHDFGNNLIQFQFLSRDPATWAGVQPALTLEEYTRDRHALDPELRDEILAKIDPAFVKAHDGFVTEINAIVNKGITTEAQRDKLVDLGNKAVAFVYEFSKRPTE